MNTLSPFRVQIETILRSGLFKRLSWYTLASFVVQGSSFISAMIVSRYLGPTNLGLYSFVQNYAGTVLTIIGGMDFYITWKLAKSNNFLRDVPLFIGYKVNIYLTLALVGISLAWVILPHDLAFMVTIILVPACIQSLNVFGYYAMATDRAKLVTIVQIIVAITLLATKIALVIMKTPLVAFIVVAATDLIFSGVLLTIYFVRTPMWKDFLSSISLPSFLKSYNFLYSIRYSIIALSFWQLLLRIDQLILAVISSPYLLGIYSAAVKIAEIPNFLAGVLVTALISRMAHISGRENEDSKRKFKKILWMFFVAGTLIATILIFFAPLFVHIIYGSQFIDSVTVLRVYALSIPGIFMNYFFLGIYGVQDRHHHQVVIFGMAVLINILLVYALTPTFGLIGTGIATAVAYTVSALGFYVSLDRKK